MLDGDGEKLLARYRDAEDRMRREWASVGWENVAAYVIERHTRAQRDWHRWIDDHAENLLGQSDALHEIGYGSRVATIETARRIAKNAIGTAPKQEVP